MSRHHAGLLASSLTLAFAAPALAGEHARHWSYHEATGPTHWAELEPGFGACKTGHSQSPIDIRSGSVEKAELPAIDFHYQPGPLKIIDNGHTIQVNYAPGSYIEVGGQRYELVQFHFHKPSEESIDGKRHDMVAHLVHRNAAGQLAVVAVLLQAGAVNPMVATLWANLPAHKEKEVQAQGVQINAADLLPAEHAYYTFAGSLTTPPCSEGVTWFVLKQPSTLSAGEIARYARAYPMNARPLQPLDGRVVRESR